MTRFIELVGIAKRGQGVRRFAVSVRSIVHVRRISLAPWDDSLDPQERPKGVPEDDWQPGSWSRQEWSHLSTDQSTFEVRCPYKDLLSYLNGGPPPTAFAQRLPGEEEGS